MNHKTNTILQTLNPADYFTLAIDEEIRQEKGAGSLCGYVLELEKKPDVEQLHNRIKELADRFPLIYARLTQKGKRFFWYQCQETPPIFFQHNVTKTDHTADFHHHTIITLLNHREARETLAPISFHLITNPQKTSFLIRWMHPFCDAKGIDLILKYLCTDEPEKRLKFNLPELEPLVNLQLKKYSLWQKIKLFFKAKRYITKLDSLQSIIHADTTQLPQALNVKTFTLTPEHTTAINKLARQHVGLTGTRLYYIGCLMRALHRLEPNKAGEAYCAPYAFNLRKNNALSPVLGNHVGTLFAQAPKALLHDRNQLFQHLKEQNTQAIRKKLDDAFFPVMWAASWLSLEKHGKELRNSYGSGTERSSFWFSDIGHINLAQTPLLGSSITKIFHLCQVTSPPAFALLNCQFNQQLTLSYNFIEPLFTEAWIQQLHTLVLDELLMP